MANRLYVTTMENGSVFRLMSITTLRLEMGPFRHIYVSLAMMETILVLFHI